uniref:Uncharacterized protein n=1 Tax=Neogobius melanostomus TaxID=47308 RepID=A0A8C6UFL2_9GOBI
MINLSAWGSNWGLTRAKLIAALIMIKISRGEVEQGKRKSPILDLRQSYLAVRDECLKNYGGKVDLKYIKGEDTTFQFDLCDVINCGGDPRGYQGYDIYVCMVPILETGILGNRRSLWSTRKRKIDCRLKQTQPITIYSTGVTNNPFSMTDINCSKRGDKSSMYFILGVEKSGTDTKGIFKISLLDPQKNLTNKFEQQEEIVTAYETSKITPKQMIRAVTGFEQSNIWLDNIYNKAKVNRTVWADVWWYCGEATLFNYLPSDWEGTCALVSLISPIGILDITAVDIMRTVEENGIQLRGEKHQWAKRSMVQLPSESAVYFDTVGVPRGISDEYKLVDEVAEGFASLAIWVTPNKNVARINYVHYNVQRVANFTVKGFHAIHEQLSATSLMTYQNRVALDLILAKEGGVCAWFQGQCCTFIPNNTAPDGTLSMALHGLRALSDKMRAVSGVQSWLSQWLGRMFCRWAGVVQAIGVPLLICLSILGFGGCCCIPLTRGLTMRAIDAAVNKRIGDIPPPYQLSQLEHTQLDTGGRESRVTSPFSPPNCVTGVGEMEMQIMRLETLDVIA